MKYTVITTFHQPGLEQYGQRMIDTFEANWPAEVDLVVYTENCNPTFGRANSRAVDIFTASPECVKFVERHRNNPEANGGRGPHNDHIFSEKKAFKWQGVRFCYKVFAVEHAMNSIDSDWIIWIDADSHTHSSVPIEWLSTVCPDNCLASYLGRSDNYHSECGWVAYNKKNSLTVPFANDVAGMYKNDSIFKLKEWHDSYVWDVNRKRYRDQLGAYFYNLNPEPDTKGLAGHPFINSELGRYMDHVKGDRKRQGHSKGKEVVMHRDHPYWRKVLGI
jgi:hypothetical protein